jgi:hypothetical protein
MKEYSSLLAVPLQKYVMCGAVSQMSLSAEQDCRAAAGRQNLVGHLEIPVAVAPVKQACW